MFSDVNFHQKGPILRPHYESRCRRRSWAWLEVCKMFGTRVSGHRHVEFEVLLSDWRAPTKRNRLSSIELLIASSFILGWASKLTSEYIIPLRAAKKIRSTSRWGPRCSTGTFSPAKSILWGNFFSDFRSQKFSYAKTPQISWKFDNSYFHLLNRIIFDRRVCPTQTSSFPK